MSKGVRPKNSPLLDTFFKNASEYQKEKFTKASFDQIRYLESLLLQSAGRSFFSAQNVKTPTQLKSIAKN
jgi:hypothetical protein